MNSHIPVSQPPTRRVSESQRKSSRQLEGFSSTHKTSPIQSLSKPELLDLREKTQSMLNNATITATLPDKGARLKEKLELIDTLLHTKNDTPETVTEEVSKMSLENNNRPNIRKKSVADANLEACRINLSSNLLQAHATHSTSPSNDMVTDIGVSGFKNSDDRQQAKVRMISLDESVRLQDTQRDRIKEEGFKKQLQHLKSNSGHGDDISTTMSRMRLGQANHSGRIDDDDDNEDNDGDDDNDDDDDDDSDYNYDSAYEEDEGSIPDEGYGQEDYYQQR